MRAALLLDRDGTLMVDRGYLNDPAGVELLPGVPQSLRRAREAGFGLFVITNQSGVARGLMNSQNVTDIHNQLDRLLARDGLSIDGYYVCPHGPATETTPGCSCRKPRPGLLLQAAREHALELPQCWMIGDKWTDALAGMNAGTGAVWLTDSTAPPAHDIGYPNAREVAVAAHLPAAIEWILQQPTEGSPLLSDQ